MKTATMFKTGECITICREQKGRYRDGYYEQGQKLTLKTRAVVQPTTGKEISQLKDGDILKEHISIFSEVPVFINDIIYRNNKKYEIQQSQNWVGNHTKSIGVLLDNECTI